MKEFDDLFDTIKTLRAPGGCPWDIDQTPASMRTDLVEECFEAVDAISQNDSAHAREELGDLIFNALVISYLYEQKGDFKVSDVLSEVNEKISRRHPHVFGDGASKLNTEEVLSQWEKIKENVEGRTFESVLDSVPQGFPPLLRAKKMLKKAGKKNFEWNSIEEPLDKVTEELEEVKEAFREREKHKKSAGDRAFTVSGGSPELNEAQARLEEETGDLLLAVVNYARWLDVDSETALNLANSKFYRRFTYVERQMNEKKIPMTKENQGQMLKFWNEAKKL